MGELISKYIVLPIIGAMMLFGFYGVMTSHLCKDLGLGCKNVIDRRQMWPETVPGTPEYQEAQREAARKRAGLPPSKPPKSFLEQLWESKTGLDWPKDTGNFKGISTGDKPR